MENDPDNEFVRFAAANWDRIAAKVDLSILLRRAVVDEKVLSWDEAAEACGVEGIVIYDRMRGLADGYDVADLERMMAAVEKAAAEKAARRRRRRKA